VVLRKLAKTEDNAGVARWMLAIANAFCGMNRKEAARSAGMDRRTLEIALLKLLVALARARLNAARQMHLVVFSDQLGHRGQ
jgi:hypothetical protein